MSYHRVMVGEEPETKADRRERKRQSKRKMRVTGRGVRLLQEIARRRAERLKEHGEKGT